MSMNSRISYISLSDAQVDKNNYKFRYNVLDVVCDSSAVILELDAHRSVVCAIADYDETKKSAVIIGLTCAKSSTVNYVIGKVSMNEIKLMTIST